MAPVLALELDKETGAERRSTRREREGSTYESERNLTLILAKGGG